MHSRRSLPLSRSFACMHVSYVYDAPFPSRKAAFIQILNTCRALAERGPSVTVYTGSLTAESVAAGLAFYGLAPHTSLQVVPLPGSRSWRGRLASFRTLRAALQSTAHDAPPILISRDGQGLRLRRKLRWMRLGVPVRYVHEAHHVCFAHFREQLEEREQPPDERSGRLAQLWARYKVARVRSLERATVTRANGLLCLTEGVQAGLAEVFGPLGPTVVLPSGTDLPEEAPPGDAARDIDVLYVGKLERRKGVFDLVEALRFLPARRLWIVGGAEEQRVSTLTHHAEAAGVADRVTFTGFVEPAQVRSFFRRARVGVCPLPAGESLISERFTSPLKILDMMACGAPIAATDLPSVRALLTGGQTALLAAPSHPEALARAIRRLLEDRALARRLAQNAWTKVASFSWEHRARRLHEFLQSIA